jgi:5-methylcytosine-specific restriction protein A
MTRPPSSRRGYDRVWSGLRRKYLAAHPICAAPGCTRPSVQVDHVQPIRLRPELRLRWDNLRAYCASCHSRRTAQDQSGWKTGHGADAEGSPIEPGHPWGKP